MSAIEERRDLTSTASCSLTDMNHTSISSVERRRHSTIPSLHSFGAPNSFGCFATFSLSLRCSSLSEGPPRPSRRDFPSLSPLTGGGGTKAAPNAFFPILRQSSKLQTLS